MCSFLLPNVKFSYIILKIKAGMKEYTCIYLSFVCSQSWEYGLPLCEELAAVYKSKILYEKLSYILVI